MSEQIDLKGVFSLAYLKKSRYTGSFYNMRYVLDLEEGKIKAVVYPGPYCFEATPIEEMEIGYFDFSDEGLEQTVEWLNQRYEEQSEKWTKGV